MDPEELKKKMINIKPSIKTNTEGSISSDVPVDASQASTTKSISIKERSMISSDESNSDNPEINDDNDIEVTVDNEGTLTSSASKDDTSKLKTSKEKKQTIVSEKRIEPDIKFDEEQKNAEKSDDLDKVESVATVEYSADPLLDNSQKSTNDTKDTMQQPAVYDTKEYYLPIKESHHGHGSKKQAIIFGIIFAVLLVVMIVFYLAIQ
jgi:hypothetical protein